MAVLIVITLIRLLVPNVIFLRPILGIPLILLMDALDWEVWLRWVSWGSEHYQSWDKLMDIYTSSIFLFFALINWSSQKLKYIATATYLWRLIGVLAFVVWPQRWLFMVFPNIFEAFFVVMTGVSLWWPGVRLESVRLVSLLVVLTGLKLLQEYFIHVVQVYPWQWSEGQFFGEESPIAHYLNILVWAGFFVLLHTPLTRLFRQPKLRYS